MTVYISSKSTLKHEVVADAFQSLGLNIQTEAVKVESGVDEQPMSIEQTYQGASNRHEAMKRHLGNQAASHWLITIESGIYIPIPERGTYFGTTAIIVENGDATHVGIDSDIEFPKDMTDRIPRDYKDLGALVQAEYGATESDPIKVFTNGQRSRRGFMKDALLNVLVQFEGVHKETDE